MPLWAKTDEIAYLARLLGEDTGEQKGAIGVHPHGGGRHANGPGKLVSERQDLNGE